jgi:hypothetical protein
VTARAFHRGHPMSFVDGAWHYSDGTRVSGDPERQCGHCNRPNSPEGHDPCIANLPDVITACCGHGDDGTAYVQFPGGVVVYGEAARCMQIRLLVERDRRPHHPNPEQPR